MLLSLWWLLHFARQCFTPTSYVRIACYNARQYSYDWLCCTLVAYGSVVRQRRISMLYLVTHGSTVRQYRTSVLYVSSIRQYRLSYYNRRKHESVVLYRCYQLVFVINTVVNIVAKCTKDEKNCGRNYIYFGSQCQDQIYPLQ